MKKIATVLAMVLGLSLISVPSFASDQASSNRSGREVTVKEDGSPADAEGAAGNLSQYAHYDKNGKADGIVFPVRNASLQTASGRGAITYAGGPILQAPKIYKIYYGSWTNPCAASDTSTAGVINNLFSNIANSAWYRTNTSYYSVTVGTLAKNYATNSLSVGGCVNITAPNASLAPGGTMVSDVALAQITANGWVPNSQDIYFVLTSKDVKERSSSTSAFLTQYCGYHGILSSSVTSQYSFVGDSGGASGCTSSVIATKSPNSNPSADAMASVIAHELVETVSDPQLNAWYDSAGYENADKCAWIFSTTAANTYTANGATANAALGAYNYFLQENAAANTNSCVSVNPSQLSTVAGFAQSTGPVGSGVTFTGTGLSGVQVFFNGVAATVSAATATSFTATVPAGATTGPVTVVTDFGIWVSPTNFTVAVVPAPTIASFTPTSGQSGTAITINGTNFTGATAVKIGTVSITGFVVVSSNQITATIPATAKTGALSVTTPGGTATSTSFTVPTPTISSFTPTSSVTGVSVTITGSNFTGATGAKIGTVALTSFVVVNNTTATAILPATAKTGTISVTSAAGTGTSTTSLTIVALPTISSFTPSTLLSTATARNITITGTNLTGATSVTLTPTTGAATVVTPLSGVSSTKATFTVPTALAKGTYKVQITTGVGTSAQSATSLTIN
jgi:hypothetical protein